MTIRTAEMTTELTTRGDVMETTTDIAPADCGDPGGVAGASRLVVGEEWTVGSLVTYECEQGFRHSRGDLTRHCQDNATWSGDLPECSYVGAIVSPEVLGAVTGALAILVLLLLPIEFLRYRLKQAQGRRMMKSAKVARKSQRKTTRQRPFMGTPMFSRDSILLPGPIINSRKTSLQTNYSSNSQTLPQDLPRMPYDIDWEKELKRKPRKKKKKKYSNSSTIPLYDTKGSTPKTAKVKPLTGNGDVITGDEVTTWRKSIEEHEAHALKDLTSSDRHISSDYIRSPPSQRRAYDNPVSLEDELQQNVFSLDTHKLPPLSQTLAPPSLLTRNSHQEVELQGRDMRDFVV